MKFKVRYLTPDGKPSEQDFDLPNREAVLEQCRAQGFVLLSLKAEEESSRKTAVRRGWEPFGVRPDVLAFFTRQLAELTAAGIPLIETLTTLQRFSRSAKLQDVIGQIIQDISGGKGLSASLRAHPEVFNKVYVNAVEVGEQTGQLPAMLARLAEYQEQDQALRSKLKSALSYPLFILMFSAVLSYAMVAYVLPGFMPMFTNSGLDLRNFPVTELLIELNHIFTSWIDEVLMFTLVFAAVMFYRHVVSTHSGRLLRDNVLFRVPIIGEFVQLSVYARLCETLSVLIESGVPVYRAMAITAEASGNVVMEEALKKVQSDLEVGKGLSASLGQQEVIPELLVQMVSVGERTGDVSRMLRRIGKYYEGQLDNSIKGFSSMIEPMMMVIIGGVVSIFVFGVFTPIVGVVNALQSHM